MRSILAIALLLIAPVTLAVDLPFAPRETGAGLLPHYRPLVVPSGDAFVAIWSSMDLDPPRFVRFRHGGEILVAGDFGQRGLVEGAVAGPDGSVLVAFSDGDGFHIATIAPDGAVHMSDPVSVLFSSMAWNGSALLFVDRQGNIIMTGANGQVLHRGAQLALTGYGFSSASPRGDGFAVTWATDNDIFVTTLLGTGQVAKEEKLAGRQTGSSAIGCNPSGTCLLLSWKDEARCGYAGSQILARSLSSTRELRFTHGLPTQSEPTIAAGATNALVAWTERSGESRIRARLFPFKAPAFAIASGPAHAPVVGTDGAGGYLVAWRESLPDEDCRTALRIRAPGSATITTLGKDIDAVQVMWNGSARVVLWEQTNPAQLLAMRVDRSGLPIDPAPSALTTAEQEGAYVAIDHEPAGLFWTGNGYLLVWRFRGRSPSRCTPTTRRCWRSARRCSVPSSCLPARRRRWGRAVPSPRR